MKKDVLDLLARGAGELGIELTETDLEKFSALGDHLVKWNKKINLTSITDEADIVVKHFIDSLTLLKMIRCEGILLDLGSGGGFPALPLKVVCPALKIVSVDSVAKKIVFQRDAGRLLGLDRFTPIQERGEKMQAYNGRFDWIVSRAFADLPTFVRMAGPLMQENGTIVAMKGESGRNEASAAESTLASWGLYISRIQEFKLPFAGDARALIEIRRMQIN